MSSTTIVLKTPSNCQSEGGVALKQNRLANERKSPSLLLISLWVFSAIFSATKLNFSSNMAGISMSFNVQDVVVVSLCAWMLHKGLSRRNTALVVPWLIVTMYGLYYNHYRSIVRMTTILKHFRHSTALPWIALFFSSLGLLIRIFLTLRILQLTANLWYRKKLEKELYESMN